MTTWKSVRRSACLSLLAALVLSSRVASGGSLQPPPGPPAPTPRSLESLGFDCPNDTANTTNLLFSFMTNQAGFDTGFSISNTASDPFGTTGQTGSCSLNFYGSPAILPVSTGNLAPGATFVGLASVSAPGFQGYVIATCHFSYAHGFAFVSDLGARNLAMGYIPQVVCSDRSRNAMGTGR
jgi:hypothetical protein